jgi:hypothetical protein
MAGHDINKKVKNIEEIILLEHFGVQNTRRATTSGWGWGVPEIYPAAPRTWGPARRLQKQAGSHGEEEA